MASKVNNKKTASEAVKIDNAARKKLYDKDRAKTLISNICFYLMFLLDIVFFVVLLLTGYEVYIAVFAGLSMGFEFLVILSMLPVPVLQVGVVQKNVIKKAVFLLTPIFEFIWAWIFAGISDGQSGGVAVYLLLAAARIIMWVTSFFLSKKGLGVGGAGTILAVIAFIFVFSAAGTVFEFPLSDRPLIYSGVSDGYVVTDMLYGVRDNVRIPNEYKGKKVIGIDLPESVAADTVKTLDLPQNIGYARLTSTSLKNLTVRGDGVDLSEVKIPGVQTIVFTSTEELPKSMPHTEINIAGLTFKNTELQSISFSKQLLDRAMQSEDVQFSECREFYVPIVENGEHYTMFYTDCHLDEEDLDRSTVIEGFYCNTVYGESELPTPDLGDDYKFLGWYTSRNYRDGERETYATGKNNLKLYAKYRYLYDINLYDGYDSIRPSFGIKYHRESEDEVLPTPANNPALERDGYVFCGWYDKSDASPVKNFDIKSVPTGSTGNKDYYPVYKKLYTVTLHTDGADSFVDLSSRKFHEWSDFETLGNAMKTGYTFMGWFSDGNYTNKVTRFPLTPSGTSNQIITQNCDLYLKFNLNYNITFNPGGGSYNSSSVPTYYHVESPIITLPSATRTGYTFDGWYLDDDTRLNNIPTGSTGDKSFTAKWTPITYNVQYVSGASGTVGSLPAADTFTYDAESELPSTTVTRRGYDFAGWSILGRTYQAGDKQAFNFASSQGSTVTATAQWEPIHYTVKYASGDGEGTAPADSTFTYDGNNTLRDCTFTKRGYHFAGWKADGVSGAFSAGVSYSYNFTYIEGEEITLTAQWEANRYTVSYSAGAENVTGNTPSSTFVYDDTNVLAANGFVRTGYTFTGWKADGDETLYNAGYTTHNFTNEQDKKIILTAQWQANTYTVIYDKNATDASGTTANSTFTYDAVNTIRECGYTRLGYHFNGWIFEGEEKAFLPGDYEYNFAPSGTVTLKARWEVNTYTVVYDKNAADATGSVANSTFTYGAYNRTQENGFTRLGYHFTGWKADGGDRVFNAGTSYNYNFTAEQGGTVTLKAQWTPNGYTVNYVAGAADASGTTESQHFLYGEAHTLKECGFTREGYKFVGWQVTVNGTVRTYQPGESVPELATEHGANVTVTATWEAVESPENG